MGSSNQARPLGRAAFYLCFDVLLFLFLFFFHGDRASCINIYLYTYIIESNLHNSDQFYPDFCIFRTELLSPISFLLKCNTEKAST